MGEQITIGRSSKNTIRVEERWDTVSNLHANIARQGDKLVYYDHSSNGTEINGKEIHNDNIVIHEGDKILLAGVYKLDWEVINKYFPKRQEEKENYTNQQERKKFGRDTLNQTYAYEEAEEREKSQRLNRRNTNQYHFNSNRYENKTEFEVSHSDNFGQANTYSQAEIDKALERWNWGAFFCTWFWAAFHRTYWPILILLVVWIPYLGQACSLCLCVYLGLKGSKIAWKCDKYEDFESFVSAQRKWAIGGCIWFILSIAVSALFIYITLSYI